MSDLEAILLFAAIWTICGLTVVYWAGVLDRGSESDEEAPIKTLFLLGPIGLMVIVVVLVLNKIDAIEFNILQKIYRFARRQKNEK